MLRQGVGFEEIYDIFAIRIIIDAEDADEKAMCWRCYSIITDFYHPNPDRLRDWISTPKANGYESLHTTVMGPGGKWVEVQIRSKRMDEIAERDTPRTGNTRNLPVNPHSTNGSRKSGSCSRTPTRTRSTSSTTSS